ncbi:MAG: hypothetical protein N2712_07735 [Brevinematales bacterium]|nr:hypothetical protein [Brevinematales bacterium]
MKIGILILLLSSFLPIKSFSEPVNFYDWTVTKGGSSQDRISVTNTSILNIRQTAWWLAAGTFVTVQKIFVSPIDRITFSISGNYTGVSFKLYNDIGELIEDLTGATGIKTINLNGSTAGLTFHLYLPNDINQDPNAGFNITVSSLNIDWYTATGGNIKITLRDTPLIVYEGATIEITADFENIGGVAISSAYATISLPSGCSLDTSYSWNQKTQKINRVGILLKPKFLPDNPPRLFAFGSDDWNSDINITLQHITPFYQLGYPMSVYILAGALYMDTYSTNNKSFFGNDLIEFFKKQNWEIGYHTYHHPHMGLCLHMNSRWIGETTRRYKRGTSWGIPNTEEEQKIELLLGKYWLEVATDRRIEGFRNPFLEFNISEGAETTTKTPLRSSIWKVIGKSGLRYVCTVNEGPSGWPPQEVGPTPIAQLDPRTAVPSWVPMCDEVTVSGNVLDSYTDFSHKIHNILVGTQRCQVNGQWMWGTIYDGSLHEVYNFATTMNFLKKYVDRHYTVVQTEVPRPYISGQSGSNATQRNIPVTFGLHPYSSSDYIPPLWQQENKKSIDWVPEIINYIKTNYADALCVTHKDILDYYLGRGTVRWIIKMPSQPGDYNFSITTNEGSSTSFQISVKSLGEIYLTRLLKAVKINSPQEIVGLRQKGYTHIIFTVKGPDGIDRSEEELDQVIAVAQQQNLGVLCYIDVFRDTQLRSYPAKKYDNSTVLSIAEPVDVEYRNKLKNIVQKISAKNISGIIFNAEIPSERAEAPTIGYSENMVNHFRKWWGPPPSGSNPQDPTTETDPNYYSIYSAAATKDWRSNDMEWLYYDIRQIVYYFLNYGEINNLPLDTNGVRVVNGLLCRSESGSDNIGVSSFEELQAWGEFRRYIVADFINELASAKGNKKAYVILPAAEDAHKMQYNATFIHSADPIEFADLTRRPCILPDKWNQTKTDNIDGIIYYINSSSLSYISKCVDMARRVDYWVAEGGNLNRGVAPLNKYNPGKNKEFIIYLETTNLPNDSNIIYSSLKSCPPPDGVMFSKDIFSSNISVSIISPQYGSIFFSTQTLSVLAEVIGVGVNISSVTYKIDNQQEQIMTSIGANKYQVLGIPLIGLTTGTHTLTVTAYGSDGEVGSSLVQFSVVNAERSIQVRIISPTRYEIFFATTTLKITAEVVGINTIVSSVTYKIDNSMEFSLPLKQANIYEITDIALHNFTTGLHTLTVIGYSHQQNIVGYATVEFIVLKETDKYLSIDIILPTNYQIFFTTDALNILAKINKYNVQITSVSYNIGLVSGVLNSLDGVLYTGSLSLSNFTPSTYTLFINAFTLENINVSSYVYVVIKKTEQQFYGKTEVKVKESGKILSDHSYVSSLKPKFEFEIIPTTATIKIFIDGVDVSEWLIPQLEGRYLLEVSLDKGRHLLEVKDEFSNIISSYVFLTESSLKIKDLLILPNPVRKRQKIEVVYTLTQKADEAKLIFFDLAGNILYEKDASTDPSNNKVEVLIDEIKNIQNIDLLLLKIFARNYSGYDSKIEKVFIIKK